MVCQIDCKTSNCYYEYKTLCTLYKFGIQASSSTLGSQKAMFLHVDAIIMYLGLNWTHPTGPVWSPLSTQTFVPFSAFQIWILPSVDPEITNWLSGLKEASNGIDFVLRWPVNVCRTVPEKASINLIMLPLVEIKMVLPSGLNFNPVHSGPFRSSFSAAKYKITNVRTLFVLKR